MNVEVKFRGKRADNGDWIYGDLIQLDNKVLIADIGMWATEFNGKSIELQCCEVINDSIGQCTGLKDKHKNEIYEGDILEFIGGTCDYLPLNHYNLKHGIGTILVVQKLLSGFTLKLRYDSETPNLVGNINNYDFWNHQSSFKIIGKVKETPELLTSTL